MKKLLILFLCLFFLVGCNKKPAEPEVTYDYDFIDYIDIDFIGPDGFATMDINIADFTAASFSNEQDYIKVKKLMNALYENIIASKYEDISNGDVIQIGVAASFDNSEFADLSMNLNVHEITVAGLKSPKTLDLYDPNNVVFYGLSGTKKVLYYFPTGSQFTQEIKDNIYYNIQIDDATVERNKTVLTITTNIKNELLESSRRYQTPERYFGANGYVVELSAEKTLKTTVDQLALENLNKVTVKNELDNYVKENGVDNYDFKQIMCIQKADTPFTYYVVALFSETGNPSKNIYVKYSVEMAYVNNEILVYSFNRESTTDEKYINEPFGDAQILFKYDLFEIIEEPVVEENTTNTGE